MRKGLLVFAVALVAFAGYWIFLKEKNTNPPEIKIAPMQAKKHTPAFNKGIDTLLATYLIMKNAFVNADSNTAKMAATALIPLADSTTLSELKNDTVAVYESALQLMTDIRANAVSLLAQSGLTEMRQDFRMIGESLYPLLKTIHYEGSTLYWQNCPMAFGENKEANWLSNTEEIVNPYLGKNHPEFKATMLHCGEVKDSIWAH